MYIYRIFTNIGDDNDWSTLLLELFTLVTMKWSQKRRKIKNLVDVKNNVKRKLIPDLLPINDDGDNHSRSDSNAHHYKVLSANSSNIRIRKSPKSGLNTKSTVAPRRSARLAQKRQSHKPSTVTTKLLSTKEENDDDEEDEDDDDDDDDDEDDDIPIKQG